MTKLFSLLILTAIGATSCSTTSKKDKTQEVGFVADGSVSAEIVDKPSNERYEIRAGEQFFRELPKRENAKPIYPGHLLEKKLEPVSVVARLIVNETGAVETAEIVDSSSGLPEFSESVLTAVRSWTFIPLKRVVGSKLEPLPFTQEYRFTFKQENGRAVVVQGSS